MSKTKQTYMRAVIDQTKRADNAKNDNEKRELISYIKLIEKKTERTVIDARFYMGKSSSASAVHCSLWIFTKTEYPDGHTSTSGRGTAGGYGYHKSSSALGTAITSAGIELWGSPYGHSVNQETPVDTKKLLKFRAHIGGCGSGSMDCALQAIAFASGWTDCIMVRG